MGGEAGSVVSLWANALVLVLAGAALINRHRRRVHPPLMLAAFALDVANAAWIEARRAAIQKAAGVVATGASSALLTHIASSVVAMIAWALALATGLRLLRGAASRTVHRANMPVFVVARVVNFFTAFLV